MTENTNKNIQQADEYTVKELSEASESIFGKGVMPECVIAAMRLERKERATISEAKSIVTRFMKKEVK